MHFILDTNIFSKFFQESHIDHRHYKKVRDCIDNCKGKFFIGGTRFMDEVFSNDAKSPLRKYRKVLLEYQKKGKLRVLNKLEVDQVVMEIAAMEDNGDFDDPHIIACSILGKVDIICTDDTRADVYIKNKKFYPKKFKLPSIYRNHIHAHLVKNCCK
jgi:predicted nucleic acid-binding protein